MASSLISSVWSISMNRWSLLRLNPDLLQPLFNDGQKLTCEPLPPNRRVCLSTEEDRAAAASSSKFLRRKHQTDTLCHWQPFLYCDQQLVLMFTTECRGKSCTFNCLCKIIWSKNPSSTDAPNRSKRPWTIQPKQWLRFQLFTSTSDPPPGVITVEEETGGGPAQSSCLRQRWHCLNLAAKCAPTHAGLQNVHVETACSSDCWVD